MSVHEQRLESHCDRCPARHTVEVFLEGEKGTEPDLKFCTHHYEEGSVKLAALGAMIYKLPEDEPVKV